MPLISPRVVYWLSSALLAWLVMQAVHEGGHVAGAWLTGGRVTQVVLHPLTISRTDVLPNPHPKIEVWSGPLFGAILPATVWWSCLFCRHRGLTAWLRYFAGFCLIANGAYLGYGVIEPIGDAEELVRLGTPLWMLGLFAAITVPCGLRLWHGLGAEFGFGDRAETISWRTASIPLALLIALTIAELAFSSGGSTAAGV